MDSKQYIVSLYNGPMRRMLMLFVKMDLILQFYAVYNWPMRLLLMLFVRDGC